MSYTPLKVKYGSVMGHDPASIFVGMGQIETSTVAPVVGIAMGLAALAALSRGSIRRNRRRSRRRRR